MVAPRPSRRALVVASMLAAGLCLGACSRSSEVDAGKDAALPDKDAALPEPKPVPTTITLENAGDVPIVVGNQCGGSFLSLAHDGDDLPYDRSCACACDAPGACGCPAICLITERLLLPGEHNAIEWDGLWMRYDDPSCYELAGLAKDDEVTATACYRVGTLEAEPSCSAQAFAYDSERDVLISAVPHSAQRAESQLVLDNETGGPIQIVTDRCGSQQWLRMKLPDGQDAFSSFCPCACTDEWAPGVCPACAACADDELTTLADGAQHAFTWDGWFWHTYESGCSARYTMPSGYTVQAEVCFTKANASEPTCVPVSFIHGSASETRLVVN